MAGATASITIDQSEIDKAVKPLFDSWLDVHKTEVNREVGQIKDALTGKRQEVTDELIKLRTDTIDKKEDVTNELIKLRQSVADKHAEIDQKFEDLKNKIEKRAARILVPTIVVVLLVAAAGVVIAIWSPLVSVVAGIEALREKTKTLNIEIESLDAKVKAATLALKTVKDSTQLQNDVVTLQGAMLNLQQEVNALNAGRAGTQTGRTQPSTKPPAKKASSSP